METEKDSVIVQMPMLGDDAPSFEAESTQGRIVFPRDYRGSWVIFFSHPADFTPVCTTEFMMFAKMQSEFKDLNTELIGLSVDSLQSHIAWIRTIHEKIEYKDIKHIDINFPLIEDIRMNVARKYGMIQPNQSDTRAVRAVFIIDPRGKIRTIHYYPLSTGRNFDELKRVLTALQKTDNEDVLTPADWRPGDDVMLPVPPNNKLAERRMQETQEGVHCLEWFMCLKKDG